MKSVHLSVIIPIYNVELYIAECLDSVLKQLNEQVEIICVDDGSTDSSGRIADEYAKKDERIQVIHQANAGLSSARNTGLLCAKGKYVCFLDSDDYLNENAIVHIVQVTGSDNLDIFLYDAKCVYETKELYSNAYKDFYYTRNKSYDEIVTGKNMMLKLIDNDDNCDAACLMCIKNDFLKENEIKFKEGLIYEDSLFYFECLYKAKRVMHNNIKLYAYRIRNNSIMTSKASVRKYISRLEIIAELFKYIYMDNFDEGGKKIILDMLRRHIYGAEQTYEMLTKEERECIIEKKLKLYEYIWDLGQYSMVSVNDDIYIGGFLEKIKKEKEIIIYGAGDIGNLTYEFLKRKNLEKLIRVYAVSNDHCDRNKVKNGILIQKIKDIKVDKNTLFIIATCDKYWKAIENILYDRNYTNIIKIDYFIERYIRRELTNNA